MQQFGKGEVLKDCHDVGKRLVECRHVDIGRFLIKTVNAIEQCVRRLVRDDVMGQRRKHDLSAFDRIFGRKVAEQQGTLVRAVISVSLA